MNKNTQAELDKMNATSAQSETRIRLKKAVKWAWPTAVEHAGADHRSERPWQCACGACNTVRNEIHRLHETRCYRPSFIPNALTMQSILEAAQMSNDTKPETPQPIQTMAGQSDYAAAPETPQQYPDDDNVSEYTNAQRAAPETPQHSPSLILAIEEERRAKMQWARNAHSARARADKLAAELRDVLDAPRNEQNAIALLGRVEAALADYEKGGAQ